MTLKKIKKVDWRYLVNRRETLLFKSITDNAYSYFKKVTGINWKATCILRSSEGGLYHSGRELDILEEIFKKGGAKLLKRFAKKLVSHVGNLDKLANQIEKMDCSKLTYGQLDDLSFEFREAAFYAHNFLVPMPVADKAISWMILDFLPTAPKNKKQEWLSILTYPTKENKPVEEERSFYKLVMAYKKGDRNFNRLFGSHVKKYSYLGARNYWWEQAWTKDDLIKRLDNFLAQNKSPKRELNNLEKIKKERKRFFDKLVKKLSIKRNSELFKLIKIAQEYAYLRTWRTNIIYGAGYKARNLFYEIARRAKANKDIVSYLTIFEVGKMAKTGKCPITPSELKRRKIFNASVRIGEEMTVLSGKPWGEKLKKAFGTLEGSRSLKILKGNIAYPGIVRGVARIVEQGERSKINMRKFKRGEIMVATMTFPNFIPAMEKAAAFVTDEGGILCHAAIVAREMKKPCIIGTKIATQVLHDGQLVEVDAKRGIVKILSHH